MLLVGFSAAAQEEFFDDVYFSSSKEKKKEKEVEGYISPKRKKQRSLHLQLYWHRLRDSHPAFDKDRDVDEYNRRYTSVDVEEPYDEDLTKRTVLISKSYLIIIRKLRRNRNAVRIMNIPNVSYVIIHRVRSRLPVQTKSICIRVTDITVMVMIPITGR